MIRRNIVEKGEPVEMYLPMLAKIQPEVIAQCQSAIDGSREFAEKWLKKYMLKNKPQKANVVARWLSEGVKYKSHGKVIDYSEAHDTLELNVEKIPPDSKLWNNVWQLYCRSILFLQQKGPNAAKLFESEKVSLSIGLQIVRQARRQMPPAQKPTSPQPKAPLPTPKPPTTKPQ